jgi:Fuc2NAc and GlcNAc transferase
MTAWWLLPLVAGTSMALTGALRRLALRRRLLDLPNERSSHTEPTPRGGGLAIVLSFLAGLVALACLEAGSLSSALFRALLGAGILVAVVGFVDDLGHVRARWRLLAHFAAAIWALACLGEFPGRDESSLLVASGWIGAAVATVYLVWLLNLYNFMDGIDGIAAVEAACVSLGAALLHAWTGHPGLAVVPLCLGAAAIGFLYWNFPPARIFMGDAGSGFLGMTLGVLSLHAGVVAPSHLWSWLILLGVFVTDATVTLLRRLIRGERVYEAHRSHAYQNASRRMGGHLPVTLAVAVINVLWLGPIAIAVGTGTIDAWTGLAVAYAPLVALALGFGAGRPEARAS